MRHRSVGFTLIELIVGLAVFGILVAIALPSFRSSIQKTKADADASDLVRLLNYARLEAIDRGIVTRVRPTAGDAVWTEQLSVYDGTSNAANVLRVVPAMSAGATLTFNNATNNIDFNNLGGLTAPATQVVMTYAIGAESRVVNVCLNGRVVLGGTC